VSKEIDQHPLIVARIQENGYPHVYIAAFQLEGAYNFGRFLADVARHGALAYSTTWALDENYALSEICAGLSDQLRNQSSSIDMVSPGSIDT
jgi:hypothetical protein